MQDSRRASPPASAPGARSSYGEIPFLNLSVSSWLTFALIQLGGPVGEQDVLLPCASSQKTQNKTKPKKLLKPNHQFNCSFRIITGVSDVEMERDHSWIVF